LRALDDFAEYVGFFVGADCRLLELLGVELALAVVLVGVAACRAASAGAVIAPIPTNTRRAENVSTLRGRIRRTNPPG